MYEIKNEWWYKVVRRGLNQLPTDNLKLLYDKATVLDTPMAYGGMYYESKKGECVY